MKLWYPRSEGSALTPKLYPAWVLWASGGGLPYLSFPKVCLSFGITLRSSIYVYPSFMNYRGKGSLWYIFCINTNRFKSWWFNLAHHGSFPMGLTDFLMICLWIQLKQPSSHWNKLRSFSTLSGFCTNLHTGQHCWKQIWYREGISPGTVCSYLLDFITFKKANIMKSCCHIELPRI